MHSFKLLHANYSLMGAGRDYLPLLRCPRMLLCLAGPVVGHYILVKNLGMLDTIWALVLPGAMSVYNMIVARTYIKSSIPEELLEASAIDGCGDGKYFFKIVLPLAKPIIAVLCLWSAVAHWNAYFDAFLYITDEKLYPLQIFVRELLVQSDMGDALIQDGLSGEGLQNFKNLMKYAVIAFLPSALLPIIMPLPW